MSDGPAVPRYDDLPVLEPVGLRHAWDVHGRHDDLGTMRHMTPATIVAATRLVAEGRIFRLDLPLDLPDPPLFSREPLRHTLHAVSRNTWDDRLDSFYPQGSTQWDALRHIRCRELGFYTGVTGDPPTHDRLGIDAWARSGIVGRGVVADVDRFLRSQGEVADPTTPRSITAAEVAATLAAQGVEPEPGDVLCVRTGWMAGYLGAHAAGDDSAFRRGSFVGLVADEAMARFLWDARLAAVVADNPALEVSPGDPAVGSLHRRLIPMLGFAVGELFALDDLADHCAASGRWTFLFVAVPLHLRGGVGSPGNAVAIT